MAIAYYVPREYGPPDQQQQQQQQPQQQNAAAAANPRIVDIHQQHFEQDSNNNNVNVVHQRQPNNNSRHNQLASLFTGLVTELLTVFGNRNVNTGGDQRAVPEPSFRARRQAAQNLPNIDIQQDNQPTAQLPDLIPSYNPLPDIVHCHAGMSFSYYNSSSSSSSTINQDAATPPSPSSSRSGYPVAPLSPASSQHHPPTTMDFEVSVKVEMSVTQQNESLLLAQEEEDQVVPASPEELYRIEGSRLRAIADNFEMSRNSRRRRVPAQSTFELKIVISVAVPTVALVALGLAYLRR